MKVLFIPKFEKELIKSEQYFNNYKINKILILKDK